MIILASFNDILKDTFGNIGSKLFPSWQAIVIQLCATLILFFFIGKFLFKPVRKILKERQDYIEKNITDSESQLKDAKEKNVQADSRLVDLNKEAQEIIASARKEAEDIKDRTLLETEEEIKEKRLSFQKEIEQEKIKANDEIRANIIDVAIAASSKVLEREVSKEDNSRLVDNFIKEVNADE